MQEQEIDEKVQGNEGNEGNEDEIEECLGIVDFKVPKIEGIELFGFNPSKICDGKGHDTSPFVLKVECYLDLIQVKYKKSEGSPLKAPRGKMPFINVKGVCVTDSEQIINYLRKNVKDLHEGIKFNTEQKHIIYLIETLLSSSIYWTILQQSYCDEAQWPVTKAKTAEASNNVVSKAVFPGIVKSFIGKQLKKQGYGRMTSKEVARKGLKDVEAIEAMLESSDPFFMGEKPTLIDIQIFSFLYRLFALEEKDRKAEFFQKLTEKNFPKIAKLCAALFEKIKLNSQNK